MMGYEWAAFSFGILIATMASSVGIGGGIFWMPIFLCLFNLKAESAVLTSLVIQCFGMGSGTLAYIHQKRVDIKLCFLLILITLPGLILGASLSQRADSSQIKLLLGGLTIFTALIFVATSSAYTDTGSDRAPLPKALRHGWAVAVGAVASGMLSISIGEWLVPILRNKLSLRMRVAVATSIATIFGTYIAATLIHLLMGAKANWAIISWAVPGVLVGGQIGPRITERINERVLKEMFIFILTLIGIHLMYNAW